MNRGSSARSEVLGALGSPDIDSIFYKLLTANDDSGRHGVLIPMEAYEFFPPILGFDPDVATNYLIPISIAWRVDGETIQRSGNYAHYHRYPERRVTSLLASAVNVDASLRLILLGRRSADDSSFIGTVLTPDQPSLFEKAIAELAIPPESLAPGGAAGVVLPSDLRVAGRELPIDRLLRLLRGISALGHVNSLRAGDTGVGYTLETMLGIDANSRLDADYEGIEIKASRSRYPAERRPPTNGHATLFAKTPEWHPIGSRQALLDRHGYVDAGGRWSLYMSIYAHRPNPQGWRLEFDAKRPWLVAERHTEPQVYWDLNVLAKRLKEKHQETVFVTAHTIREGPAELFRYDQVVHCKDARLTNFLTLIDQRVAFHDFAMHRRPDGSPRDHGFLFRLNKSALPRLFATVEERLL